MITPDMAMEVTASPEGNAHATETKHCKRGRPPKYNTSDMSVASMAAILTTMAGGGVKPHVMRVLNDNVVQLQEGPDARDATRPYSCELCARSFKEVKTCG